MPILARFLPSEPALIDMALAFADPHKAPMVRLAKRIRQGFSTCVLLSPLYFFLTCVALLIRTLALAEHYTLKLWAWNVAGLVLSIWLAIEVLYIEEYFSRFGL